MERDETVVSYTCYGGEEKVERRRRRSKEEEPYLDDVVLEADAFLLLAGAVLDVEDTDEVGGPAAQEAVEDLQQDAGQHPQLGEGVRQRQEHLRHLHNHDREEERRNSVSVGGALSMLLHEPRRRSAMSEVR